MEDFINALDEPKTKARYVVRDKSSGVIVATYEIAGEQAMIEERIKRHRQHGDIVTVERT